MGMNSTDVIPGTDATSTQYNNLRKDLRNAIKDPQADSDGATITFDLSTGAIHSVTLGGARTLAISNATVGQTFVIRLVQDGTGSRTVTWFSTIKWPDGVAPTLSTTAARIDIFTFYVSSAGNYECWGITQNLA